MTHDRRGVFFVHVMKTGGGSLRQRMLSWFEPGDVYPTRSRATGWHDRAEKTLIPLILGLAEAEGRPRDFYAVHMPAWVAEAVAPRHARVTALREPVARTISHLRQIAGVLNRREAGHAVRSLDELYDDPRWYRRLANYQVRIFSQTRAEYESEHERRIAMLPGASHVDPDLLFRVQATGVEADTLAQDGALGRAIGVLDRFDVVGVTEQLDPVLERVAALVGQEYRPVGHVNPGFVTLGASKTLIERVRADQELDVKLYEHARARAVKLVEDRDASRASRGSGGGPLV